MSGKDEFYCYPPDFTVLKNKFGHRDADSLARDERMAVVSRILEGPPSGEFDLAHLQAIHKHLFQDVYEWAGEIRETPLAKGGHQFMSQNRIGTAIGDVHNRLVRQDYLKGLSASDFAKAAGNILGDVNFTHPFREGNGRTQFQYLKQLGHQAGHRIDLTQFDKATWIAASREAHDANYGPMGQCIAKAIGAESSQTRSPSDQQRLERLIDRYESSLDDHQGGKPDPDQGQDR